MTELCQIEVTVPIQVGRSIFAASPYDNSVSEISEFTNTEWEDKFYRHLIFPPFPTAIGWEKNAFFFYRYDRIMSFGSWIGWKSERVFSSPSHPLWQSYVVRELNSHGKWEVLSAPFSLCQNYDKNKWIEEYRSRGVIFPFARLCCVSFISRGYWFPLDEWGDVFSSTTE